MLQTLDDEYTKEFSVALRLKNIPEDVVITTDLPSTLKVSVHDKGSTLIKYLFWGGLPTVTLDFNSFPSQNGHVCLRSVDLQKQISAFFSSTTKIIAIRPDSLEFFFNHGLCKKVPVCLVGRIEVAQQYFLSRINYFPDSVLVYSTQDQLDTITAAYTRPVNYSNLSDTLSFMSRIRSVRGAKFVPSLVRTTLYMDLFTEKTVEVPVQGVNFPAAKQLRTFPATVQVTFQVGLGLFKRIKAEDFVIAISYEELLHNKTNQCYLHLRSIPSGITHVRINPEKVEYLIEDIGGDEND